MCRASASLDSHAAAKEIGNDSPAASAAHAAGQAVATAHVPLHALGSANYALQALYRDSNAEEVEEILKKERAWQMEHLVQHNNRRIEQSGKTYPQ